MRKLIAVVGGVVLLVAPVARAGGDGVDLLKDGLDGFDVRGTAAWSIEDGILTGKSGPGLKGSMLFTKASYADFELDCEFLGKGFKAGKHTSVPVENFDSGLFFRNRNKIQVQLGISRSLKKDMTGSLYVAGGGYKFKARDAAGRHKAGEWHKLKLRVQGDRIKVWLSDELVLEATTGDFPEPGPIGFQIHGGVQMEARFRNLQLVVL